MADEENQANELWLELVDLIAEIKMDCKDNRRMRRHVRELEAIVNQIGNMLTRMGGKKGFLR
jgi:hypothetical protein